MAVKNIMDAIRDSATQAEKDRLEKVLEAGLRSLVSDYVHGELTPSSFVRLVENLASKTVGV